MFGLLWIFSSAGNYICFSVCFFVCVQCSLAPIWFVCWSRCKNTLHWSHARPGGVRSSSNTTIHCGKISDIWRIVVGKGWNNSHTVTCMNPAIKRRVLSGQMKFCGLFTCLISNIFLLPAHYCNLHVRGPALASNAAVDIPTLARHLTRPRPHGRSLVGNTGDVSPHFFRWGDTICHVPLFFSSGFAFGEVSKIKVMLVTFWVKSFSC